MSAAGLPAGAAPAPLGVYVHFPYCLARCPYCDFATQVVDDIPHDAYADAVLRELDLRLGEADWSGREVVSVYFGGGTPSLWKAEALGRVVAEVRARLPVRPGAEITVEANPGAVDGGRLADLRAAGPNRISFGTQSFGQRFLEALGRWHTEEDSLSAVDRARSAGFERVSVDLIYATPGQTPADAAEDGRRAVATGADHVSTYALTLERHVPMARDVARGRVALPDEDRAVEAEAALFGVLAAGGLRRYEISNHARPGFEAVHNTLYWTGGEYLGLGASASGFHHHPDGTGRRWTNHPNGRHYLDRVAGGGDPTRDEERLGADALLSERMFLGLRLVDGIDLDEVLAWSGLDPRERFGKVLESLQKEGLVRREGARLAPTPDGLRLLDTVAVRFL